MSEETAGALRAEHVVAFSYQRTTGGATGRFLVGLARREVWGSRRADGRVVVPPVDHDPDSGAATDEFVQVSDHGTVRSWTWVADPEPGHPLRRPFAFALIRLDGADTDLLHVVDAGTEDAMTHGLRVRAAWRDHRGGTIADIEAFRPADTPEDGQRDETTGPERPRPPDTTPGTPAFTSDLELRYAYEPGLLLSAFLRELGRGRVTGGRCPGCDAVYVPPVPRCPACGAGPMTAVGVADRGVVESFAVVRVPPPGSGARVPFAWAWIRLDGASVPFPHLLGDVPVDEVRAGMRVRAVWVPASELAPTWANIRHFGPES